MLLLLLPSFCSYPRANSYHCLCSLHSYSVLIFLRSKPDKREFLKISQAVGVGFLVMGVIGYIVKLSTSIPTLRNAEQKEEIGGQGLTKTLQFTSPSTTSSSVAHKRASYTAHQILRYPPSPKKKRQKQLDTSLRRTPPKRSSSAFPNCTISLSIQKERGNIWALRRESKASFAVYTFDTIQFANIKKHVKNMETRALNGYVACKSNGHEEQGRHVLKCWY